MNVIDCHTHSLNSPDGISGAEDMVKRACEMGLSAYALTDHCEINQWFTIEHYGIAPNDYDNYDFGAMFEKSMRDNCALKKKYGDKINFICGIELGQANFDFGLAQAAARDKRLDFVIGSLHQIKGKDDFAFIDYKRENIPALLEEYFKEIYDLCKWNKFDILAHLTYPLRYICGEAEIDVDLSEYEEIIRLCFRTLAQNGKGIEINTSGFRQKYGKPLPTPEYVKMFRDEGGEIISVGSDAHCTDDLGKNIADGAEIALEAGFKYLCCFKSRNPQFISIK